METTITLSTERILEQIYALSALRCYTNSQEARPHLLTRDNRKALLPIVSDAVATTAIALIGVITDIEFDAESPSEVELVTLTLDGSVADCSERVRRVIESAVTYRVLGNIYIDSNGKLAMQYDQLYRQAIESARYASTIPGDIPDLCNYNL